MTDSGTSTTAKSRGESHRIYWQQWPSAVNANKNKTTISSRRDLITSSAAIRISPEGARAKDVTQLLCETLNLNSRKDDDNRPSSPGWDRVQDAWEQDSLVLVGTLYSLPPQHVRFEHERLDLNAANNSETTISSRHDPPFHVIKTLAGTDNPIQVRNEMIKHLESILRQSAAATPPTSGRSSTVSPKLQWYFVPGVNHPSSPIPSHIDLDGYSTSMEDDDNDYDDEIPAQGSNLEEDDQQESEHDLEGEDLLCNLSLSLQEKNKLNETDTTAAKEMNNLPPKSLSEKERIFKKERDLYFELSMCQSSIHHDCMSGYLLKQSMADPHVWKRMHCVLTDEHLWFISRIYTKLDEESQSNQTQQFYSFAKHRRLGLTRALLLQPSADKPKTPLFRTPFAFEIIDATGSAHRFRASNPENYKRWVGALQSRIVQAYENSLFEHAELIVRDETEARNKRFQSIVVEPLWEYRQLFKQVDNERDNKRHTALDDPTLQILNFGIEVNRYREHCRHIEAILPAKYPVLAMTDSTPELRINNGGQNNGNGSSDASSVGRNSVSSGAFRLDTRMQALIKSAWDEAVRLGGRATKLAVILQCTHNASTNKSSTKMPSSLETICQHLEYVITGSFRASDGGSKSPKNSNNRGRPDNTRQYPPPVDLFDQLLIELQNAASIVSAKTRKNAASSNQTTARNASKSPPRRQVIQGEKTNGGSHP